MKRVLIAVIIFLSCSVMSVNGYCEGNIVLSAEEPIGNSYERSVSAFSARDLGARANAIEAIVTNKNEVSKIALIGSGKDFATSPNKRNENTFIFAGYPNYAEDYGSFNNIAQLYFSGDIVVNGPIIITDGQALIIDGTLTINSDIMYMTGSGSGQNSGSSMSVINNQTSIFYATDYGAITQPLSSMTITGGTISIFGSISTTAIIEYGKICKAGNDVEMYIKAKLMRDRLEKQRQGLSDILNGQVKEKEETE